MKIEMILLCLFFSLYTYKKENIHFSDSKENNLAKKQILDTVISTKKDSLLEQDLLYLKNVAYCLCVSNINIKILKTHPNKYKIFRDNSAIAYASMANVLDYELFLRNKSLNNMIENWNKKLYQAKPPEEESNNDIFLIQMQCLNFYNSDELNSYIDSIRVQYYK